MYSGSISGGYKFSSRLGWHMFVVNETWAKATIVRRSQVLLTPVGQYLPNPTARATELLCHTGCVCGSRTYDRHPTTTSSQHHLGPGHYCHARTTTGRLQQEAGESSARCSNRHWNRRFARPCLWDVVYSPSSEDCTRGECDFWSIYDSIFLTLSASSLRQSQKTRPAGVHR